MLGKILGVFWLLAGIFRGDVMVQDLPWLPWWAWVLILILIVGVVLWQNWLPAWADVIVCGVLIVWLLLSAAIGVVQILG